MIEQARFGSLKFGAKLVSFSKEGKISMWTYLCRNPRWEDTYCYLVDALNRNNVKVFSRKDIETYFYTYDDLAEAEKHARDIEVKYHINKLKELGYDKQV